MIRRIHVLGGLVVVAVLLLAFSGVASAAKGGGGKPAGGGTSGSSSLSLAMVTDSNGNGLPNWGDQVTFNASTTATTQPHVSLQCFQSGVLVYTTETGYYAGYPWPWTQIMTLSSPAWAAGAADCTATAYYFSGRKTVTLGALGFHVDA